MASSSTIWLRRCRELRSHNFTEIIDRHFSLGSHLNARDVKAVRKTVSGLTKLLYPHGEVTKDELAELVELALEGRRRVKEQLKKMGSFEYHQTSFSYIDNDTREEHYVGVPEQGGRDMISPIPSLRGRCIRRRWMIKGKSGCIASRSAAQPELGNSASQAASKGRCGNRFSARSRISRVTKSTWVLPRRLTPRIFTSKPLTSSPTASRVTLALPWWWPSIPHLNAWCELTTDGYTEGASGL